MGTTTRLPWYRTTPPSNVGDEPQADGQPSRAFAQAVSEPHRLTDYLTLDPTAPAHSRRWLLP